MNSINRFFPKIFALLAILGKFAFIEGKGNLLLLPDAISHADKLVGVVRMGTRSPKG